MNQMTPTSSHAIRTQIGIVDAELSRLKSEQTDTMLAALGGDTAARERRHTLVSKRAELETLREDLALTLPLVEREEQEAASRERAKRIVELSASISAAQGRLAAQ